MASMRWVIVMGDLSCAQAAVWPIAFTVGCRHGVDPRGSWRAAVRVA
jgi:hypothetical protein